MPFLEIDGDLFDMNFTALAHGCNCTGVMGKGIALSFKSKWPRMYNDYRRECLRGNFNLGDVHYWFEGGTTIFNLGTQVSWKSRAELTAIRQAVKKMIYICEEKKISCVGMPRIGSGLGRLEWNNVRHILNSIGLDTKVELIVVRYVPNRTHL